MFDNLKKSIAYTLTHLLPELWPIFLNLALGFPSALGGILILSVDLITEQVCLQCDALLNRVLSHALQSSVTVALFF